MPTINASALSRLLEANKVLRDVTGNKELQLQTSTMFAFIALRHPNEISMGEIEDTLKMAQTTTSRNLAYLAKGSSTGYGGYKLIEVYEDEHYRRRKLVKLTKKGEEVAAKLSAILA